MISLLLEKLKLASILNVIKNTDIIMLVAHQNIINYGGKKVPKKKIIKRIEKIDRLFEKAKEGVDVNESIEIVKREPNMTFHEKYDVVFLLGRLYERQQVQAEMDKLFEEQKQKEGK